MKKRVLSSLLAAALAAVTLFIPVQASDEKQNQVIIEANGGEAEISLSLPKAEDEKIATVQLTVKLETSENQDITADFSFAQELEGIKVKEARWNPDGREMKIFLSDSEFLQVTERLPIGTLTVTSEGGESLEVTAVVEAEGGLETANLAYTSQIIPLQETVTAVLRTQTAAADEGAGEEGAGEEEKNPEQIGSGSSTPQEGSQGSQTTDNGSTQTGEKIQTGDNAPITILLILMVVSLIVLVPGTIKFLKKLLKIDKYIE